MTEIWKDIPGWEGYYQGSTLGCIKNLARFKAPELILSPRVNMSGYQTVQLCRDSKPVECRVHRLIALTFISNPHNKPQVNHKNKNRQDNRVENLEWVTNRENGTHRYSNEKKYSKYTGVTWCKERGKWLAQIRLSGRSTYLGRFNNEEDARDAYQEALKKNNLQNKYAK